ncbi:MAG: hypothetical protein Q9165_005214 [Trypethelium subeluteriae]
MDPLSLASAIVAFPGFAGQVLEGVQYLCHFLAKVKDAPRDIQRLSYELQNLRQSLQDIQKSQDSTQTVHPALIDAAKLCQDVVSPLSTRISRYEKSLSSGNMERRWARVKSAFTELKSSKMIEDVQRARTALLDARMMQLQADTSEILRQQAGLSDSVARLEKVSTGVNEARVAAVSEDIQHVRVGPETNSTILRSNVGLTRANNEQMGSIMETLPQLLVDIKDIKSSIHKALQHQQASETSIDTVFERAVSRAVIDALSQLGFKFPADRYLPTSPVELSENTVRKKLLYSYSKTYWFGYLSATSTRTATSVDDHGRPSFTISTDFVFTPARWVSRWVARLELLKCVFSARVNTWLIRTSKILKDEDASLLAKLLLHGTSEQFQSVVRKRDIRPNDLILSNNDGFSLLQVCVDWLSIVGIDSDEFIDDMVSEFVHERFSPFGSLERAKYVIKRDIIPHRTETVKRIGETCLWLLDYDTCGAIAWVPGRIAELVSLFDNVDFPSKQTMFGTIFSRLSMITSGNPFHDFASPREYIWLDDLVGLALQGTSRESQSIELLAILHSIWTSTAYCSLDESLVCSNIFDILIDEEICYNRTRALAKSAISSKVWLAGDEDLSALMHQLVFEVIRGALAVSSPLSRMSFRKFFHVEDLAHIPFSHLIWMGQPRDRFYALMAKNVSKILEIDHDVILTNNSADLSLIAAQWHVLDVWAAALALHGLQPNAILPPSLTTLIRTDYNPLAYTSTADGAFIALHHKYDTGRACLVMNEIRNKPPSGILEDCTLREGEKDEEWWKAESESIQETNHYLTELTHDWQYKTNRDSDGRGMHCQIKTSPVEVVYNTPGDQFTHRTVKRDFWNRPAEGTYELRSISDGGIELFIEIDDVDAPWERLCQDIRSEGHFRDACDRIICDLDT